MTYHDPPTHDSYSPPGEIPDVNTSPVPHGDDGALFVDPYDPVMV